MNPEGKAPDWYFDLIVAQELGVSVIELDRVPFYWRDRIAVKLAAENWVENERSMRNRHMN